MIIYEKRKNKLLLQIFFYVMIIFNAGADDITEHDIPMPKIIYDLPEQIIGNFFCRYLKINYILDIYETNKFIMTFDGDDVFGSIYGHIRKKDEKIVFDWIIPRESQYRYLTRYTLLDYDENSLTLINYTSDTLLFERIKR